MDKLKTITFVILEGILFGFLGGFFLYLSLRLFHFFTFEPPSGGIEIHIIPLYKMIVFPTIILFLLTSFIFGKAIFKLLKKQHLQWFYNVIFFIIATIGTNFYIIFYYLKEMEIELSFETIDTIFNVRNDAGIILFSIVYSFLYQLFKTYVLTNPKPIC